MNSQQPVSKPSGPKPWYDPRVRALVFQALALAAVFWAGWAVLGCRGLTVFWASLAGLTVFWAGSVVLGCRGLTVF